MIDWFGRRARTQVTELKRRLARLYQQLDEAHKERDKEAEDSAVYWSKAIDQERERYRKERDERDFLIDRADEAEAHSQDLEEQLRQALGALDSKGRKV